MKIDRYGISLVRMQESDIQLIRSFRNLEAIRSNMFHQGYIDPAAQVSWFNRINNSYNYYFLIVHNSIKIGVVYGKDVSADFSTVQGGIFIGDVQYRHTYLPVAASVCLAEMAFQLLGIEISFATIVASNTKQIRYNQTLGYIVDSVEHDKVVMSLNYDRFCKITLPLAQKLSRITGTPYLPLTWSNLEFTEEDANYRYTLYSNLPDAIQQEIDQKFLILEATDR